MIDKNRVIAITDGVMAIAATIMVLQLDIPDVPSIGAIKLRLPVLISYVVSYLQIFMTWHEHHDVMKSAERINHRIFLVNVIWLFFITLLPFATGLVGKNFHDQMAVIIYIIVLTMITITIKIETMFVIRLNGGEIVDQDVINRLSITSLIAYALGIIVSFFNPFVSFCIVIAETLLEVVLIWIYDGELDKEMEEMEEVQEYIAVVECDCEDGDRQVDK